MKKRQWLIDIRNKQKKTQKQVAKETNFTRQYYLRIEKGDFKIPIETAKKIAEVLKFNWELFYKD